jgi:hypothetical protein
MSFVDPNITRKNAFQNDHSAINMWVSIGDFTDPYKTSKKGLNGEGVKSVEINISETVE